MAPLVHIVLFQFKPGTTQDAIDSVCNDMIGLKDKCVSQSSGKPYIKSSKGGIDNSPEGMQDGLTHGFVVEFESGADRDYYVHKDPAHQEFIKGVKEHLIKAQVIDFHPGVF